MLKGRDLIIAALNSGYKLGSEDKSAKSDNSDFRSENSENLSSEEKYLKIWSAEISSDLKI